MTQTFTCWRCGATRRLGDEHRCGRLVRASFPRRRWRTSPVAGLTFGMLLALVVWIALVVGVLIWGVAWRFM